jgi:hypothetical protein
MTEDAALFASVRGSYRMAMGQDRAALDAYRAAQRLSGNDPHYQLSIARHLAMRLQEPAEALETVNGLLKGKPASTALRLEARAVRGLALLSLNRGEEAIEELREIPLDHGFAELPSLSCDLTLVEELSRKKLAMDLCRHYLDVVESKARAEKETRVHAAVQKVRAVLDSSTFPSGEQDS